MILELLFALNAHAATDAARACPTVKSMSAPSKDQPSKEEIVALKGCHAGNAYYGVKEAVDYKRARHCAFAELANGSNEYWGGHKILFMLYANGQGVSRNLDLAMKFACDIEAADAEMESRLTHIEKLREDSKAKIDYCDDITSGQSQGFCRSIRAQLDDGVRAQKLQQLGFSGAKYDALVKAAAAFREARATNEIDQSGTGRSAFVIGEQSLQDQDFFESLEKFKEGKVPKFDFKKENIELNKAFKKILATKNTQSWGTVTRDAVNQTQKAWVAYRNSWRAFAGTEKADQVDAWLTKKRTHMLKSILGER